MSGIGLSKRSLVSRVQAGLAQCLGSVRYRRTRTIIEITVHAAVVIKAD